MVERTPNEREALAGVLRAAGGLHNPDDAGTIADAVLDAGYRLATPPLAPVAREEVERADKCATCGFPWGADPVRHADMCGNRVPSYASERAALSTPAPVERSGCVDAGAIPAGMVAWHGGDDEPEDLAEGLKAIVMFRDGGVQFPVRKHWKHTGGPDDIIAYTPKPAAPTPAVETVNRLAARMGAEFVPFNAAPTPAVVSDAGRVEALDRALSPYIDSDDPAYVREASAAVLSALSAHDGESR